ncbi:acyltransferase family protein [Tunturiibacter gelidiferens]|uniref:acyltransferase family protein n=1 Tax=Tunturiibacter gelidiferens TaxID=3069689 RepID=UPI003D9B5B95
MPIMTVSGIDAPSASEAAQPKGIAPATQHNAALDGLRGVAILSVMLYHFTGTYKGANPLLRLWSLVAGAGWMGVDLFFVLSGFLITGILYDTAHAEHKVRNFYARRALRIFPLFYAVLFGLLLLTPVLHMHWRSEHLLYFFYLSNADHLLVPHFQSPSQWVNLGHLWSLAVEEQFYLLWPFVVWRVKNRTTLLRIILAVLVAGPILRALLIATGMDALEMSRLLVTRADSLLFGGGVALLARAPSADRIPTERILITSVSLLAILLYVAHGPEASSAWIATVGYSAIAMCFASLIFLAQEGSNWVTALFDRPLLRFFGRYSYGLYLFHGLYFVYLRHLAGRIEHLMHSGLLAQLLIVVFGFLFSIVLAVLSYHFFEAPILTLKRRFT